MMKSLNFLGQENPKKGSNRHLQQTDPTILSGTFLYFTSYRFQKLANTDFFQDTKYIYNVCTAAGRFAARFAMNITYFT